MRRSGARKRSKEWEGACDKGKKCFWREIKKETKEKSTKKQPNTQNNS